MPHAHDPGGNRPPQPSPLCDHDNGENARALQSLRPQLMLTDLGLLALYPGRAMTAPNAAALLGRRQEDAFTILAALAEAGYLDREGERWEPTDDLARPLALLTVEARSAALGRLARTLRQRASLLTLVDIGAAMAWHEEHGHLLHALIPELAEHGRHDDVVSSAKLLAPYLAGTGRWQDAVEVAGSGLSSARRLGDSRRAYTCASLLAAAYRAGGEEQAAKAALLGLEER